MEKKLLQNHDFNSLEKPKRESRRIFTENEEDDILNIYGQKNQINVSMTKIELL